MRVLTAFIVLAGGLEGQQREEDEQEEVGT
jgi:hypothetical protein